MQNYKVIQNKKTFSLIISNKILTCTKINHSMVVQPTKKGRGGKREGAGAKPKDDKKRPITIYIEQSIIDGHDGVDNVKIKTKKYLKRYSVKR
jgi:hypothetical protein